MIQPAGSPDPAARLRPRFASARRLVSRSLAAQIRPRPPLPLSRWLEENVVLVDGPSAGDLWSRSGAPYLAEIADCLVDDHPANLVTVRKSQQTGVSVLGMGWALYVADREPANMLYAVPGLDMLRDLSGQKLQPLIDAWQKRTRRKVFAPVTARSGEGSTTLEKRFPGGYLQLANANSAMDLSSRTIRKGVKDEVSKWEDIPGRGDPETLFFGRFTAFRRTRGWKILELSTPEIDTGDPLGEAPGHCRIDRSFRRSDRRFWHMACPHCGHEFVPSFRCFAVDRERPQASHLVCPESGCVITEPERVAAVRVGRWIALQPGPDRHPGFHVDAFISLMMSLADIASDFLDAEKKGEKGLKDFSNLVLGLPYQMRGSAPEHTRLMERREAYAEGFAPPQALLWALGVDVQHTGLWCHGVAYAPDRQSWVTTARFIEGDTTDHASGAFAGLAELIAEGVQDSFGRTWPWDMVCIDAGDGGRANQVYAFARGRANVRAIHGVGGWRAPAYGQAVAVSITLRGKKKKRGAYSWPIGTWALKSTFYAQLHLDGVRAGKPEDPPGYCHFGDFLDERFFRQITAESLTQAVVAGRRTQRWTALGENHLLDARVYADAAAEMVGLTTNRAPQWDHLRRLRGVPSEAAPDLLSGPAAVAAHHLMAPGSEADQPEPAPPVKGSAPDPLEAIREASRRMAEARKRKGM
jgi:phage terminase large subunit GpA-like protein